ncbi:hypothetical protein A500_16495 [Clostridium sartagoforme AAU1]|uniref:Uncharacterized protein n=1 Tax=Clostridium sartagoforme AAU1 TaxID=1202534 RepID=R9BV11_9CLOT|nr:Cas9 inhibitor AcrIIA9 family protein [Clostridium sartagoforme]EOR20555.1 hypothetical protein A500_16495 [Clostridium sartagoforme AAU1]
MLNKAIKKINDEIEKEKNPYVKVIGEYLLKVIAGNEGAAEKILAADKTIMKSLEAMRKAAEKNKVGNMAMISDEEGFAIVLKYFEIKREKKNDINDKKVIDFKAKKEEKEEDIFNVSLDDYI